MCDAFDDILCMYFVYQLLCMHFFHGAASQWKSLVRASTVREVALAVCALIFLPGPALAVCGARLTDMYELAGPPQNGQETWGYGVLSGIDSQNC